MKDEYRTSSIDSFDGSVHQTVCLHEDRVFKLDTRLEVMDVNPKRWQEVAQIYSSALARGPHQRAGFLSEACRNDSELLREVEALRAQPSVISAAATATLMSAALPAPPPSPLGAELPELKAGRR